MQDKEKNKKSKALKQARKLGKKEGKLVPTTQQIFEVGSGERVVRGTGKARMSDDWVPGFEQASPAQRVAFLKKHVEKVKHNHDLAIFQFETAKDLFYNALSTTPVKSEYLFAIPNIAEFHALKYKFYSEVHALTSSSWEDDSAWKIFNLGITNVLEKAFYFPPPNYVNFLFCDATILQSFVERIDAFDVQLQSDIASMQKKAENDPKVLSLLNNMMDSALQARGKLKEVYKIMLEARVKDEALYTDFEKYKKNMHGFFTHAVLKINALYKEDPQKKQYAGELIKKCFEVLKSFTHWKTDEIEADTSFGMEGLDNLLKQTTNRVEAKSPKELSRELSSTQREIASILSANVGSMMRGKNLSASPAIGSMSHPKLVPLMERELELTSQLRSMEISRSFMQADPKLGDSKNTPPVDSQQEFLKVENTFKIACKKEEYNRALEILSVSKLELHQSLLIILENGTPGILQKFLDKYIPLIPSDKSFQAKILKAVMQEKFANQRKLILDLSDAWHQDLIDELLPKSSSSPAFSTLISSSAPIFVDSSLPKVTESDTESSKAEVDDAKGEQQVSDEGLLLDDEDPRPKLQAFLEIPEFKDPKKKEVVKVAQLFALSFVCIQYLEALSKKGVEPRLENLTRAEAECLRNALVHQHISAGKAKKADRKGSKAEVGLLLDGAEGELFAFCRELLAAEKTRTAAKLRQTPLFGRAIEHGKELDEQKVAGTPEKELLEFEQLVIYTRFFYPTMAAIKSFTTPDKKVTRMLQHAEMMLERLLSLYCEKFCSNRAKTYFACTLMHSDFRFPDAVSAQSSSAVCMVK